MHLFDGPLASVNPDVRLVELTLPANSRQTDVKRLGYSPELDRLRGSAILLVIAGHAFSWSGGGRGVDLFFVLSGFLITTLLLEERAVSGRVDLVAFYGRRARRLLPALIVFLAAYLLIEAA